jgi:hypothetical protein
VGTEDEYMHAKATAVFRDSGAREIVIQGAKKNEYNYVSAALPSTRVGKSDIGGLNVSALFGEHENQKLKRPKRSDKSEYVQVFWKQSNRADVRMTLSDQDAKKTIDPYKCANAFDTSYYCEFIVDRVNLIDKVSIIATASGQPPGIIPLKSIANAQYLGILSGHKMMPRGSPLNAEGQAALKELSLLDPSIPATLP